MAQQGKKGKGKGTRALSLSLSSFLSHCVIGKRTERKRAVLSGRRTEKKIFERKRERKGERSLADFVSPQVT